MMKKMALAMIAALSMASCVVAPLMQEAYFNRVATGSNISEIEMQYGKPYEIRPLPDGTQEYLYIQRIELGSSAVEQLEFVFLVNQGRVVGKQCKRNGTSSFQFVH